MNYPEQLKTFQKNHDFFIGIDSDGCAFPTMELKHKECFIPNIIKYWGLQTISKEAREAAEFVNLYSVHRGMNRFPALVLTIELLNKRKDIQESGIKLPDMTEVQKFIDSDKPTSNAGLAEYLKTNSHPDLENLLKWSESVNASIADMVHGVSPFPHVKDSLEKVSQKADIMVVSSTPVEALNKEWSEHSIAQYVQLISGQEMGTKKEHLKIGASGKYKPSHILMIGDAPGDHKSAQSIKALFFPIKPGHETESWKLFYEEAADKFFNEEYDGAYQERLLKEFYALLPETPNW